MSSTAPAASEGSPTGGRLLRNTELLLIVYCCYTALLSQFLNIPSSIATRAVLVNLTVVTAYFLLACFVSWATIYSRYHYAVDTVAGLAVALVAFGAGPADILRTVGGVAPTASFTDTDLGLQTDDDIDVFCDDE